MYNPRRLRGLTTSLAILTAALLVEAVLLNPAVLGFLARLPGPVSTSDLASFKFVTSGLGDALREGRTEGSAGRTGLGVLIGSSTLEWAVDTALIPPGPAGSPTHWLKLNVIRANGRDIRHMGRLLLDASFRPDLAVLGLNPVIWARTDRTLDDPTIRDIAALRRHLAAGHEMLAKRDIEGFMLLPLNRILPNRLRINRVALDALFDARIGLFATIGYGLDSLFPPLRSIPRGNANAFLPARAADAVLETQMEGLRGRGVFDPASFAPDSPNVKELLCLIGELRAAGAEVVLVLLPEMEYLRILDLPEASRVLHAELRRAFGTSAPPVLDLRAAMPEWAFYDLSHLNPRSRAAFSVELGRTLAGLHERPAP